MVPGGGERDLRVLYIDGAAVPGYRILDDLFYGLAVFFRFEEDEVVETAAAERPRIRASGAGRFRRSGQN